MQIRVAGREELGPVGELTVRVYVGEGFTSAGSAYVPRLRDATHRAAAAELLVALDPAGRLLGSVTFTPPGSEYAEIADVGEAGFRMLVVDPAARGQGVGKELVRACVARATALGCPRVRLSTQRDMHAAHRLYERLGFLRTPDRDWSPLPGVDLITYALDLR